MAQDIQYFSRLQVLGTRALHPWSIFRLNACSTSLTALGLVWRGLSAFSRDWLHKDCIEYNLGLRIYTTPNLCSSSTNVLAREIMMRL